MLDLMRLVTFQAAGAPQQAGIAMPDGRVIGMGADMLSVIAAGIAAPFVDRPMHQPVLLVVDVRIRDSIDEMARQAIHQTKCDRLHNRTPIVMRQISAFKPAFVPARCRRSQQDARRPVFLTGTAGVPPTSVSRIKVLRAKMGNVRQRRL